MAGIKGRRLITAADRVVDGHVGERLRLRREARRVTQQALAEGIGVTFQQVQKYESGGNRIATSRLVAMATFLEVPIGYFFEGLPGAAAMEWSAREMRVLRAVRSWSGDAVDALLEMAAALAQRLDK